MTFLINNFMFQFFNTVIVRSGTGIVKILQGVAMKQHDRKRSLGAIKPASKTKPNSPDGIGTMKIQRHTLEVIWDQLCRSGDDEITVNLAAWENETESDRFLTVELSPRYEKRRLEPLSTSNGPDVTRFFGRDQFEDA